MPAPVARLLRIMISAARADGELGERERERILAEAREVGADALVRQELDAPRPLGELVLGVTDPELKQQLYTLAFVIVRADEAVTRRRAHLPRPAREPARPRRGRASRGSRARRRAASTRRRA